MKSREKWNQLGHRLILKERVAPFGAGGFAHQFTSKTLVITVLPALFIISPLLVFIVITATTISVAVATYVLILPVTY